MNRILQTIPFKSLINTQIAKSAVMLLLVFFSSQMHAQLPVFTLSVTPTAETCPGNGTLTISTSNTDPAATIVFRVYLLPNDTTPIAVPGGNFVGGLASGTYRIIATQTLGTDSNTQTLDVTIDNEVVPLAYTTTSTMVTCNNNGTMTVNVFSGIPVAYEIISGPMIKALQPSNVFTGLAAGVYQVRVFDNCGDGWVTTHTVFSSASTSLGWAEAEQAIVVDCDEITITNNLSAELNNSLSFPITVVYTVYPPGGGTPIVSSTYMASGDVSEQEFVTTIPYYSNQVYSYNVTVTDACGNVYTFDSIEVNKPFVADMRKPPAECGEYFLNFALDNYMAPVTVNFLDAPAGFDPVAYNPNHPGPFYTQQIDYGDSNNGVPYGYYKAELTDGCGRTVIVDGMVELIPDPQPNVDIQQNIGCDSGTSTVTIKVSGFILNSAIILTGPVAYSTSFPVDVSALISTEGSVEIEDMPSGFYTAVLTDTCGNTYNFEFTVPDMTTSVTWSARRGCETGMGSIRIRGNATLLTSVIMTSAPAAYVQTFPYDVSFNISPQFPDVFSMNNFPPGVYEFLVTDSCNLTNTVSATVLGYEVSENTYSIVPYCGSFDLNIHFVSQGTPSTLWLQKFDPVNGTWGHPETNVPCLPGESPDTTNSYSLPTLDGTVYSISYLGDFRIVHRFESFENGSVGLYKTCTDIIQEFTFLNELEITGIQKATCNGVSTDVSVTATGVPPITYQITTRNGLPFFVDNGTNNIFTNLDPAVYNFLVFDTCGNVANRLTDVALLPSLVIINQPGDMIECDDDNDGMALFHLPSQNPAVLGSAIPANYTITYHLSAEDAANDINPLPDDYISVTDVIYCREEYMNLSTCYDVTSFNIIVNPYPLSTIDTTRTICEGRSITLAAEFGFDSYLWSTGATTPSIVVSTPGIYTLKITKTTNGVTCTATYSVNVVPSAPAAIHHIETVDWTNDQNTISVILDQPGTGNYVFSLDNVNFQASNTFYGLQPGDYTVYIKDLNGCDPISQDVYLLAYPKFFTPNGDNYNDYWQIINADAEPNLKVYIFDRYGKLLTGFGPQSRGWDGKYNGQELPSTDYWFLVKRENGMEHRGHFAMKR